MKKTLKLWQIAGFAFTGIWGVLLHFLYDWTNQSIFAAPFSAVNESIWEHMKLLFFPMFVFALIEYGFTGKSIEKYWCVKLFAISSGLILIPIIYYSYTGIFGVNADWFNIVIFFIADAAAYYLEAVLFKNRIPCKFNVAAFIILCVIALLFIVFTFVQPQLPIFRDPTTGGYGR
ncbi:MAG: hypothetical protein IKJ41_08205 [Clostridia bacterium]|nr:hypothetical protein [Clostridia bacterium]